MTRPTLILLAMLSLGGCKAHVGDAVANLVLTTVAEPFVELTVVGIKAAHETAYEYWESINSDDGEQVP